jgi:hypothetical protein
MVNRQPITFNKQPSTFFMDIAALFEPVMFLKLACLAFLSILFLQSGLDKVFDYSGNMGWLKGHFENSPLKGSVIILLPVITLLEFAAGLISAIGFVMLILQGESQVGLLGAQLSALSILCLFFGQRLAKEYVGASVLAGYFVVCLISIYVMSL